MVSYGKDWVKQPIGLLKVIEIILIIVILVILFILTGHFNTYYGGPEPAMVFCLILTLLILIFSMWKAVGDAIDCVLKFQFILLILEGLWLAGTAAMMLTYNLRLIVFIVYVIALITGVLYFVDAFISFKAYNLC